jgi:antitoxin (DNA-binding transcriptional repressor) of toxin-antitoxin stability system
MFDIASLPDESTVMTKDVALDDLREHLDEYVGDVTRGATINVIRDGNVLATLAPPHSAMSAPSKRLQDFVPGPRPTRLTADPAEMVIEERDRERSGAK